MPSREARRPLRLTSLCLLTLISPCAHAAPPTPAERAINSIRREALPSPTDSEGWRLPLAASWNVGSFATGFGPSYQIAAIEQGHYLLPWFGLSEPRLPAGGSNYPSSTDTLDYYEPAIRFLAEHHLPLSIESTQWETLLSEISSAYAHKGPDGRLLPVSPFDPEDPWYAVGRAWARHPTLRRMQQLYPDPPLVLFVSNNEHPKLTPAELHARFRADAAPELIARRRTIGDAWIERYRAMERGLREGLEAAAWRKRALFVGYDAFVTPALGRWDGWPDYSLYVPGRIEPWPYAWDGASPSYYLHDWAPDADFIVWSPQIEAMNYLPLLAEIRRTRPDFWFEISVWDGQEPGLPSDKRRFYQERGQEFTPSRYGGMVQFGMWLLRPRVVREFRNPEHDRIRFGKYFDAILAAVARVHDDATLRELWRSGRLLDNPAGAHPYQATVPGDLASRARWFLLDTPANPPRPWQLTTSLRVYALALEKGTSPRREWLVYAFAPRDAEADIEVSIPGGPKVHVPASTAGAFVLVSESDGSVRRVGLGN